jgi:hypothetical protein
MVKEEGASTLGSFRDCGRPLSFGCITSNDVYQAKNRLDTSSSTELLKNKHRYNGRKLAG